jgi:hypothetical protein
MKGYEGAKASYPTRTIKIQDAILQVIALRRLILRQLDRTFYDYQSRVSTEIIKASVVGGNNELAIEWPRRSGKTEMLVDTGLAIGLFWIHVLCEPYSLALVNPARTEQGVMVTRQRIKDNVARMEGWLNHIGVESVLGDGRKTPDYVLHDSSGTECSIRAISADPSAHSKGAGFKLLFLEQVEEIDEETMKAIIYPMAEGEHLEQTLVLAGNPGISVINNRYRELTLGLEYPYFMDWKTCSQYRPDYKQFAMQKMKQLGEESDEFRTQLGCEWIIERSKPFIKILPTMPVAYIPDPKNLRGAGVDNAKDVDFTVLTIMERTGDKKIILDWLELQGNDYQEQAGLEAAFLKPYGVRTMVSDATGQQDAIVEDQAIACRGICRVEGLKLTVETNDLIYKEYQREIVHGRLLYIDKPPDTVPEERRAKWFRCRAHFIEQHMDVERQFVGNKMKLKAPDRKGMHDDYVTSGALALYCLTHGGFKPSARFVNI